jgi:hypothetical protein
VRRRGGKYDVAPAAEREYLGRRYDSKAEMLFARRLEFDPGVRVWMPQVGVDMGTDPMTRWILDFLVIPHEQPPYLVDVKGMITPSARRRIALFSRYGRLPLLLVRRVQEDRFEVLKRVVPEACEE